MNHPPRSTFQPAGAGAILVSGTAVGIGVGTLIGWAAGSPGIGALIGTAVGIPAGIYAVYRRYRGFFT
jgi:F0F1-type ATP synthase assembly protein I